MKHLNNGACLKCLDILKDCSIPITTWFTQTQIIYPQLHTSCGHRGEVEQNEAFRKGASKAKFGESPHNLLPAKACDIFFLVLDHACFDLHLYKELADILPPNLESGIHFPKGFVDAAHIQERDWK